MSLVLFSVAIFSVIATHLVCAGQRQPERLQPSPDPSIASLKKWLQEPHDVCKVGGSDQADIAPTNPDVLFRSSHDHRRPIINNQYPRNRSSCTDQQCKWVEGATAITGSEQTSSLNISGSCMGERQVQPLAFW